MIDWNKTYNNGADFRAISQRDIDIMLGYIPVLENTNSLDIGCGTGHLTRELWHRGFRPVGVDTSERAIELARSYTVLDDNEISYEVFNLETQAAANLTTSTFSLITCKLVYAFITDKTTFLSNVSQLLDKDGAFIILTPLKNQVSKEKAHIAVEYEKTLRELEMFFNVETKQDDIQAIFVCKLK